MCKRPFVFVVMQIFAQFWQVTCHLCKTLEQPLAKETWEGNTAVGYPLNNGK